MLGAVITAVIIAEKFSKRPASATPNPDAPASTDKKIRIAASPERVWEVLSQIDQWPNWLPDISKAKLNGPLQVGTTFDWTSSGMAIHSTLHTVTPQEALGWSGEAFGAFAIHNWHVKELAKGMTEVRIEESMEGWLVSVLGPILQRGLDKGTERWLKALKDVAEAR